MRIALVVLLGLMFGCVSKSDKSQTPSDKNVSLTTLRDSIQGIWWADTSDPSAAMEIDGDSVHSPEHFTCNAIDLHQDSITLNFLDKPITYHVAMRGKDTLVLSGGEYGGNPTAYFRWDSQ